MTGIPIFFFFWGEGEDNFGLSIKNEIRDNSKKKIDMVFKHLKPNVVRPTELD